MQRTTLVVGLDSQKSPKPALRVATKSVTDAFGKLSMTQFGVDKNRFANCKEDILCPPFDGSFDLVARITFYLSSLLLTSLLQVVD